MSDVSNCLDKSHQYSIYQQISKSKNIILTENAALWISPTFYPPWTIAQNAGFLVSYKNVQAQFSCHFLPWWKYSLELVNVLQIVPWKRCTWPDFVGVVPPNLPLPVPINFSKFAFLFVLFAKVAIIHSTKLVKNDTSCWHIPITQHIPCAPPPGISGGTRKWLGGYNLLQQKHLANPLEEVFSWKNSVWKQHFLTILAPLSEDFWGHSCLWDNAVTAPSIAMQLSAIPSCLFNSYISVIF